MKFLNELDKPSQFSKEIKQQLAEFHVATCEIFALYNSAVRTPANWKEESERLEKNMNSRARWKYKIPESIGKYEETLRHGELLLQKIKSASLETIYDTHTVGIVEATLLTARQKMEWMKRLGAGEQIGQAKGSLPLFRKSPRIPQVLGEMYERNKKDELLVKTGESFSNPTLNAPEAKEIIERAIQKTKERMAEFIQLPEKSREAILNAFTATVHIKDDPSFLMRCITDPKTQEVQILLSENKKYSEGLMKVGFYHEFCGHALESAVFDRVFIPNDVCSPIFSYGGVSSPNIFDVKAEGFADSIVGNFLETEEDKQFLRYRLNVWIPTRAYANHMYHQEGATIGEIVEIFTSVGLKGFAMDEAIMVSIFFDGIQAMYDQGLELVNDMRRSGLGSGAELMSLLLLAGKVPHDHIDTFIR